MKLLIVDDEELTRRGIMSSIDFEELGISEIYTADDGLSGLEEARIRKPDIIISDVRMPRMTGIEMLQTLTSEFPELVAILMSGFSDREYLKAAIKLKAVSYVDKPIQIAELNEAVRVAISEVENKKTTVKKVEKESADELVEKAANDNPTIKLVKEYISENYSNPSLSVRDIGDFVQLSVSYVCTYFKNETGTTLNQYLTEFRMEKAKELLSDPRNKIAEISEKVGYNDGNYFSKSFRKFTGVSPSEYREKQI